MLTPQEIASAVTELTCLNYFPRDESGQKAIMKLVQRMVERPDQLRWLINTMIDQVGEWKGPTELRGVYCSRYKPLDGIEADSSHARFSPESNESRAMLEHAAVKRLPAPPEALALVKAREWPR